MLEIDCAQTMASKWTLGSLISSEERLKTLGVLPFCLDIQIHDILDLLALQNEKKKFESGITTK